MGRKPREVQGAPDSRQRLIDATGRLLRIQGYHATGLNQIVEESEAPKGSLYHYFPEGKEQLAGEALREAGVDLQAKFRDALALEPGAALDYLIETSIEELVRSDYRDGCPIATVALETNSTSPYLRAVCCGVLDHALQSVQRAFMRRGLPADEAEALALTVFATFEGALLLSKVRRSPEPLRKVAGPLKKLLR